MRRLPALILSVCLHALAAAAAADTVPMGDLHCNDAQGNPAPPYQIGTPVEVAGIVTAGTGVFAAYTNVNIQDDTGGMTLYRGDAPVTFVEGDSVTAAGTITTWRGLTEIDLQSWTIHGSGHLLPEPYLMTCYEVAHPFGPDGCEPQESMLIRIDEVTFTGTWGSNQLVTLHDASGSCGMYIDADTGIHNSPPPEGPFDVIGILRQYDTSAPYTAGYQIMPRSIGDFIQEGPSFLAGPVETEIQPDQVTIRWTTDVPSTSRVDYGYTGAYELGSVEDLAMVTEHAVTLGGLAPARIHRYRAASSDGNVETVVSGLRFCSGSRSSGSIEVYFNKSVDTALALGEWANGQTNLLSVLVPLIDEAERSIDVALYSFNLAVPADALIAAHQRGVEVRFITDNRDTPQEQVLRLIQAGIPVIEDDYGYNNGHGLMHHKFWIFDHRLDDDPDNDYVLTGSWNVTSQGTNTDAQNVIVIQDESVAAIFTAEMDEMWGSTTGTPNPNLSRFGDNKLDDTPKIVSVGGVPGRIYFGPSDDTMPRIVERIGRTERSVHFGILSFTRYDIANAMKYKYLSIPDYAVRGVFDSAESGNQYSVYHEMVGGGDYPWDPPADIWLDGETGSLHHKYIIFDVNDQLGTPGILTGSSNWSNSAQYSNDENLIFLDDFRLANLYFQEFARRYRAAGGTADLTVDAPEVAPDLLSRVRAFPNPAAMELLLQIDAPEDGVVRIGLHDVAGRILESREVPASAGTSREMSWDLSDRAAGIYFIRVSGAGIDERRRVALLR